MDEEIQNVIAETGMSKEEVIQAIRNYHAFLTRENRGGRPSLIRKFFEEYKKCQTEEEKVAFLARAKEELSVSSFYRLCKWFIDPWEKQNKEE